MFSVDCNFYKKGKGHDSRNQITPYFDFSQPTPSCKFCLFRESPTAYYNEAKIFINSYLKKFLNPFCFACSTLGLLPLHKSKWVQLNGKTLQVLKKSLLVLAFLLEASRAHCSRIDRYPNFIALDFFHFSWLIPNGDNQNM